MSRLVNLGKIVLLGPRCVPNLDEKRLRQVNEFVKVVVGKKISVGGLKVFIANPVLHGISFNQVYQTLINLPSETIFSPPPNSPTSNSSSIS